MSDFGGLLSSDYGFKRQGKSAPMAPPKRNPNPNTAFNFDIGALRSASSSSNRNNFSDLGVFNGSRSKSTAANDFEEIFAGSGDSGHGFSSLPVFDKPVYDDEVDSFDDLLGGLNRKATQSTKSKGGADKSTPSFDDLLPGFGGTSKGMGTSSSSDIFSDPLEEIGKKVENPASGGVFDEIDPFDSFGKSVPVFSAEMNGREKDASPIGTRPRASVRQTASGGSTKKKTHVDVYQESPQSLFDTPSSVSADSHAPADENVGSSNDIWLTVSEVPLFTQPTTAPPPSRPPPPRPPRFSRVESHYFPTSNAQKKGSEYSSFGGPTEHAGSRGSNAAPIDELEDFAMARTYSNLYGSSHVPMGEEESVAAMREAVDKAEIKFRQGRGERERECARISKSRESAQIQKEEKGVQDAQERKLKEHQERLEHERRQRERDEEERRQSEEEEIRRIEREREEKEREKRRIERERELARQAVDRAAREARERAAAEARSRAERAAVQKAHAEARGRAEKAAVQRVQAEARERAVAEAKERAEKASAEARDRARSEAREKEVQERTAETAARASQQKNENDLESFFGVGSRASSAVSKPAEATRTPVKSSSNTRKASSSTNVADDLSSIFGGPTSSGDFQEVEGETEDRRRARLERHLRTQERAAKALAEKYARDLEIQKEQTERHRIGETLDFEIKRWATGKEGNLRALLSTMQYVLWPECGWQPISLTDLITGAAVKKAYRKATLCIHPDKVQQKGATLQQKYIAEKVFDLLKEAWNKFNSEELF